ncbi:hypothetical protein [Microbacterium sp. BK668]|uniref:hypothetical protein n=1 Tax=Microbacterium sp. BK668 TaxID=2512118 RepID=UPI00105B5165|nr:hypothetical protein [Microbacterium sp. BK668]TDN91079.1 hypothetical protein EV279_0577 [Microbacterium sp. BK668]
MDIATHPTRVPVFRLLAIGTAVAFAYLLFALLMGFGSGDARADDGGDQGGLLGGVTGAVDSTVGDVTQAVQDTTQAVTTTVQQVVQAPPAPAQPVVQPVVSTVTTTVQAVVQPVAEVAESAPVGAVVQPVVDAVTAIPVVGDVAQSVGVGQAVTDAASTVDEAAGDLVTTIADTTTVVGGGRPPLVAVPDIDLPSAGGTLAPTGAAAGDLVATITVASAAATTWAGSALTDAYLRALPGFAALHSTTSAAAGLVSTAAQVGGILSSALVLGACAPGDGSPMGSNGAGPGALALAAFAPLVAYRAWMRRNGWNDDVAPPAPTYDTDVAPD